MSNEIEILNPLEVRGWDDQLEGEEHDCFFYTSNWARVLMEAYDYHPHYFVYREGGRIAEIVPLMGINSLFTGRRGVSLPFTDYCSPLVNDPVLGEQIFQSMIRYGNKQGWNSIEIRGESWGIGNKPSSQYYIHHLDLCVGEQEIFGNLNSNTRRNVSKAQREGVEIRIGESGDSVREFYRLNCLTRKRHGLPPQPYEFFRLIFKHIISENLGLVLLAYKGGACIAGGMFFHFGKHSIYKFGASDMEYKNCRANSLIIWEAIRWYARRGFKNLCFGKTELGNMGLRRFKAGWGSSEQLLKYSVYDLKKGTFTSRDSMVSGWHNGLFAKIPIPFAKLIGGAVYRHVG